jgi:hypothetical protein
MCVSVKIIWIIFCFGFLLVETNAGRGGFGRRYRHEEPSMVELCEISDRNPCYYRGDLHYPCTGPVEECNKCRDMMTKCCHDSSWPSALYYRCRGENPSNWIGDAMGFVFRRFVKKTTPQEEKAFVESVESFFGKLAEFRYMVDCFCLYFRLYFIDTCVRFIGYCIGFLLSIFV